MKMLKALTEFLVAAAGGGAEGDLTVTAAHSFRRVSKHASVAVPFGPRIDAQAIEVGNPSPPREQSLPTV
jgi:hypothetical protein